VQTDRSFMLDSSCTDILLTFKGINFAGQVHKKEYAHDENIRSG
jgi:hypothetical protein